LGKAEIIVDKNEDISERYRAELLVWRVEPNVKYPEGVKARFALIDKILGVARLVVDNHAPFGFHVHAKMYEDRGLREKLETTNYEKAMGEFLRLAMEIVKNER